MLIQPLDQKKNTLVSGRRTHRQKCPASLNFYLKKLSPVSFQTIFSLEHSFAIFFLSSVKRLYCPRWDEAAMFAHASLKQVDYYCLIRDKVAFMRTIMLLSVQLNRTAKTEALWHC